MYRDFLLLKRKLGPFYIKQYITSLYDYDNKMPYVLGHILKQLTQIASNANAQLISHYDKGVFHVTTK